MSALFDQVQKQAQMLTPQEKAALAHQLIEELDSSTDADVEQLWIEESRRRYQAYLKGDALSVPGDEVMAKVRNRLTSLAIVFFPQQRRMSEAAVFYEAASPDLGKDFLEGGSDRTIGNLAFNCEGKGGR